MLKALRRRRPLLSAAFVGLAFLVTACDLGLVATPPPSEGVPGPGFMHLTSDPTAADQALRLRYIGADGVVSQVGDEIEAGAIVSVDRAHLPGAHRLQVNDVPCDGSFQIRSDMETDVVVRMTSAGCTVATTGIHAVGAVTH